MATKTKKVIFFSHASADRDVVQSFKKHLFDKKELNGLNYELFFTSTKDLEDLLPGGANTWRDITDALHSTVYFFAFLSESYFESQWCIAELALFSEICKDRGNLPEPALVLIDNTSSSHIVNNPLTQNLVRIKTSSQTDLERIVTGLQSENIPIKILNKTQLDSFAEEVTEAKSKRDDKKKGIFFELAKRHFSRLDTSSCPISFLIERDEYEQTSISMGESAQEQLLWTVFKSPLLVEEAYDATNNQGCLMSYDKEFIRFNSQRKIRLVIFRNHEEAKAYDKVLTKWHNDQFNGSLKVTKRKLEQRKKAFERSVKNAHATLLFTNADRLGNLFSVSGQNAPKFDEHSFLEFAYGDYGLNSAKLLMESGFSSPFSRKHATAGQADWLPLYGHITFYIEPDAEVVTRISDIPSYNNYYGHLSASWKIAKEVFQTNRRKDVFFQAHQISNLYT